MRKDNYKNLPLPIQSFLDQIIKDKDLRWGGIFAQEDPVHIDYPLNKRNLIKWELYTNSCIEDFVQAEPKWKVWFSNIF